MIACFPSHSTLRISPQRTRSTLHHPNVVLFLGACTRRPNLCLVLEFCVHGSLHHFLKNEASHGIRITMSLIYRFALDIARGVYYLHRRCSIGATRGGAGRPRAGRRGWAATRYEGGHDGTRLL